MHRGILPVIIDDPRACNNDLFLPEIIVQLLFQYMAGGHEKPSVANRHNKAGVSDEFIFPFRFSTLIEFGVTNPKTDEMATEVTEEVLHYRLFHAIIRRNQ